MVVGISMIKDEADIVEATLRHLSDEVDVIIVADNGSTDGTSGILRALATELSLIVFDDPDPAYRQSQKMSALADRAAALNNYGDTWVVPFDADEIWYAAERPIRDALREADAVVAFARLTNHLRTDRDLLLPNPVESMVWAQAEPQELPKVAFRWQPGAVIHQGNHNVTLPVDGPALPLLAIRHFPIRSAEQYVRKARNGAAAYAAAPELPEDWGAHWRSWGQLSDDDLHAVFQEHWWYPNPLQAGLVRNPAPYRRWHQPR